MVVQVVYGTVHSVAITEITDGGSRVLRDNSLKGKESLWNHR